MLLLLLKDTEVWLESCTSESETGPVCEKIKPAELVDVFPEGGILAEYDSFLGPETSSGRSSDDADEGASVASNDPTGYGVTGISIRDEADGLYLIVPNGWSNLHVAPNLQCPFCK